MPVLGQALVRLRHHATRYAQFARLSTRVAGSLLPTGRLPSDIASLSLRASQSDSPPAGASSAFSWRKSDPDTGGAAGAGTGAGVMDRSDASPLDLCTGP